jgi:hypothetical protein
VKVCGGETINIKNGTSLTQIVLVYLPIHYGTNEVFNLVPNNYESSDPECPISNFDGYIAHTFVTSTSTDMTIAITTPTTVYFTLNIKTLGAVLQTQQYKIRVCGDENILFNPGTA